MKNPDIKIDLVYTWVDGNDPVWRKKRDSFRGSSSEAGKSGEGRFANNDELKFSLRSVEKFAPWINRIFIVTDGQSPDWLNTQNPRVKIIDHSEILPPEALPTFNSTVIEHALHNIPGLSQHFLYANDDMFFGRSVSPSDFFMEDGTPIVRFNRRPFRKFTLWIKKNMMGKKLSNYNLTIHNTALMVEKRYGKYIGNKTHHNIDAYTQRDYASTFETFRREIEATFENHFRSDNDVQRNIYSYVPILEGKAKVKFVTQKESFRCHIDNQRNFNRLESSSPLLFCLNDSEYANDIHRRNVKEFLERRFPSKSSFEK
ncbi:MAG: Stealth CR1 domain-containing protein [Muribaculaceae bacterium]|nr:Stealth CR1 domain-containing protein [Muribaculaceae bacterium]